MSVYATNIVSGVFHAWQVPNCAVRSYMGINGIRVEATHVSAYHILDCNGAVYMGQVIRYFKNYWFQPHLIAVRQQPAVIEGPKNFAIRYTEPPATQTTEKVYERSLESHYNVEWMNGDEQDEASSSSDGWEKGTSALWSTNPKLTLFDLLSHKAL